MDEKDSADQASGDQLRRTASQDAFSEQPQRDTNPLVRPLAAA